MFSSERKLITTIIVACLVLGLFGYSWKQRTNIPAVSVALEYITTPFAYGASRLLANLHTGIDVLDVAITEKQDASALEEEKAQLIQKQVQYDEIVAENLRLRQLLQFRGEQPQFDMVLSHVIMRDMGGWTDTFVIDRGRDEGMAVNMAVVVPGGLVGFISDVYEHSSRVQTILDPRSGTGVIVQRPESRVASVVKGNGNEREKPMMVHIPRDSDVLTGDTLITSGYGGVYPKGIIVGHVLELVADREGFVKNAVVKPSANFRNLEEVFVIVHSREGSPGKANLAPKLIPQTQRDQVQGVKGAIKE